MKKEKELDERQRFLDSVEKDLDEEKRKLELELLKKELEMTKDKTVCLENMMNTVFRNHTLNKTIMTSQPVVLKNSYDDGQQVVDQFRTDTETTTVD